jgi:hypothetical protein
VKLSDKIKWIDALIENGAYSTSRKNVVRELDEWDYASDEVIRSEAKLANINLALSRSIDDLRCELREKAVKAIPKPPPLGIARPRSPTDL